MNAHGGPSTLLVCALLGAPAADAQERVSGVLVFDGLGGAGARG
jgi:hypothetical protein